jgi:hypothetical protein
MTRYDRPGHQQPSPVDQASAATPREEIVPLLPELRAFARSLSPSDVSFADDLV